MVIRNSILTFVEEGLSLMDEISLIVVKPYEIKNKIESMKNVI